MKAIKAIKTNNNDEADRPLPHDEANSLRHVKAWFTL